MNTLLTIVVWLAAVATAVLAIHWLIVFPVLVKHSAVKLRRIQDEVRMAVLENRVSREARPYHDLEWFIDGALVASANPVVFSMPTPKLREHEMIEIEQRIERIKRSSSPEIDRAFHQVAQTVFMLFVFSHPGTLVMILLLAFAALFFQRGKSVIDKKEKEAFARARLCHA